MISLILLNSFLLVLKPRQVPLYREGMFGVYNPSQNLSKMTNRDKFWQDKIVMMEFLTELMTVERCVGDYPVEDEFLRGIKELDRTREVPMYLAFAAQIFLDIHHILREKVTTAQSTYFSPMELMHDNLRLHLEFHKNLRINHWSKTNDLALLQLQSEIEVCYSLQDLHLSLFIVR